MPCALPPRARVLRARSGRGAAAVGLALALGLSLTGCSGGPGRSAPAASPPPSPTPSVDEPGSPTAPSSSSTATAAPGPTTAIEVRSHDAAVSALGDLRILVLDEEMPRAVETTTHPAAERWEWIPSGTGDRSFALVAAPEGARFTVFTDRSIVVTDASGVALVGIAPLAVGTFALPADDLLELRAHPEQPGAPVHAWLGQTAVLAASWGRAEGGRSLAVEPTPWTRAAGEAGAALAWRDLEELAPEDATPGMHDQLVCHALGAPDKATWNLEPWRPDVGLLAVLAAACNPT